jgi:hypothetical protein
MFERALEELDKGQEHIKKSQELAFLPGAQQMALLIATFNALLTGDKSTPFTGAAGTGKTTTLQILIKLLELCGIKPTLIFPTHKALGRAEQCVNGVTLATVHSTIYKGAEETIEEDEEGNKLEFASELTFGKREPHTAPVSRICIIDESSMIGKAVGADLMQAIPQSTQVVAVGDPHQLPPVSKEGEEPGCYFNLDNYEYELTEVYRQASASPVLQAATTIRTIKQPYNWTRINGVNWKAGQKALKDAGVPQYFLSVQKAAQIFRGMWFSSEFNAAAIVGMHKSRTRLNDAIRLALGFSDRKRGPVRNERLICRASSPCGLKNSQMMRVIEDPIPKDFGEYGHGWICRVIVDGKKYAQTITILASTWLYNSRSKSPEKDRGLIPYSVRGKLEELAAKEYANKATEIEALLSSRTTGDESPNKIKQMERECALELGCYSLWLQSTIAAVDTGYAITCHASQGSEWEKVLIVADWIDFIDTNGPNLYKWSYTALTRATKEALVVQKGKCSSWKR